MTLFFKYKSVQIEPNVRIFKPLIPLTLLGQEKIDILGILDSGSDITIIPREIARVLGIKCSDSTHELASITGDKVFCRRCKVRVKLGSDREHYEIEVPAIIPEKDGMDIVIGRMGFFSEFKITFIESQRRIELKKIYLQGLSMHLRHDFL